MEAIPRARSRSAARGHGAAGDCRSAQHLPCRGDEAGQLPRSRRGPADGETASEKLAAAPPQGGGEWQNSRRQSPRAPGLAATGNDVGASDREQLVRLFEAAQAVLAE